MSRARIRAPRIRAGSISYQPRERRARQRSLRASSQRARDSVEPEAMSRLELLHRVGLRGLDIETSISSDARCERGQPRLEKPEARASCAAPCRAVAPLAARCARLRVTPTRRRPPRFFALSLKHRDVWIPKFEVAVLGGKWAHGNSDSSWTGRSCIAHATVRVWRLLLSWSLPM